MISNTHSMRRPGRRPDERATLGLTTLAAAVDELAAQDLNRLPDAVGAERVLELQRLLGRLEGHWLQELATADVRGAAGAELGEQAASTASWLRGRLRMGAGAAAQRCSHRPGPVPRSADGHRPSGVQRRDLGGACPGPG